jgi:hypothetical protein
MMPQNKLWEKRVEYDFVKQLVLDAGLYISNTSLLL